MAGTGVPSATPVSGTSLALSAQSRGWASYPVAARADWERAPSVVHALPELLQHLLVARRQRRLVRDQFFRSAESGKWDTLTNYVTLREVL